MCVVCILCVVCCVLSVLFVLCVCCVGVGAGRLVCCVCIVYDVFVVCMHTPASKTHSMGLIRRSTRTGSGQTEALKW